MSNDSMNHIRRQQIAKNPLSLFFSLAPRWFRRGERKVYMKIARFFADSMVRYGIVEGDDIIELVDGEIPSEQNAVTYLLPEVTPAP